MLVTITRASDQTRRVEYEPIEMQTVSKKEIADKFGRCETGEVITVKESESGEVLFILHWLSQIREYKEYTGDYYNRYKSIK